MKRKLRPEPFRLSLRIKLALPTLLLVILMILILFGSTFRTVRSLMLERNEGRLKAITEVFAETVKVPLILKNQQVLLANIEWMAKCASKMRKASLSGECVRLMFRFRLRSSNEIFWGSGA